MFGLQRVRTTMLEQHFSPCPSVQQENNQDSWSFQLCQQTQVNRETSIHQSMTCECNFSQIHSLKMLTYSFPTVLTRQREGQIFSEILNYSLIMTISWPDLLFSFLFKKELKIDCFVIIKNNHGSLYYLLYCSPCLKYSKTQNEKH